MKTFAKIFLPVIIILLFSNCHKPYDDYDMLETVLTNGVWAVSKGEYIETSITIDSATQEVIDSVVSFDDTELTEKDKDMRFTSLVVLTNFICLGNMEKKSHI